MTHKFLVISLLFQASIMLSNPYLQAPQHIAAQELEQMVNKSKTVDFTWMPSGMTFNCLYKDGDAGFAVTALAVPDDCKELFQPVVQDGVSFFAYTKGVVKEKLQVPEVSSEPTSDYYVAQPRSFKVQPQPVSMNVRKLAEYIKKHAVVFYTGAGLSIASGVLSMAQLEAALHIERCSDGAIDIQNIIMHSAEIMQNMKDFCQKAIEAEPSIGHAAITLLARKKQCAVFTENIDMLHQKSGIVPRMASAELKKDSAYFKEIDAIICIGLSHDDRGLLAFFKECNPAGVVIAIDLKQPDYLGAEDMFVVGDLQDILPVI